MVLLGQLNDKYYRVGWATPLVWQCQQTIQPRYLGWLSYTRPTTCRLPQNIHLLVPPAPPLTLARTESGCGVMERGR